MNPETSLDADLYHADGTPHPHSCVLPCAPYCPGPAWVFRHGTQDDSVFAQMTAMIEYIKNTYGGALTGIPHG